VQSILIANGHMTAGRFVAVFANFSYSIGQTRLMRTILGMLFDSGYPTLMTASLFQKPTSGFCSIAPVRETSRG
jgi:hypothetical protein